MKRTYRGSCHCGRLRYEAEIDLQAGTGRCNCSICGKLRYWGAHARPEDFHLLCDEAEVGDYLFGTFQAHHRFCRICGVHAYGHGTIAEIGGAYVSINVACLDDVAPEELAALPVRCMDGQHDNWWNEPIVKAYL